MEEVACLPTLDVTDDDGRGREELHLMCNPVVLKRFFAAIPSSLLPNFRLVCKLWYNMTLPRWRNEVTCTFPGFPCVRIDRKFFYEPPSMLAQLIEVPGDYISSLHKFLHYVLDPIHDCRAVPFRKFKLTRWQFRPNSFLLEKFNLMCAENITDLWLDKCVFYSVAELGQTCFGSFPVLRKLKLKGMEVNWEQDPVPVEPSVYTNPDQCLGSLRSLDIDLHYEDLPITWMELFSRYPNMTEFKVYNAEDSTLEKILTAIKVIRNHDQNFLKIITLHIMKDRPYAQHRFPDGVAVLLEEVHLPLETLTIDLGLEGEEEKIRNILAAFAPSLKRLNAYRGPLSNPYSNFPFGVRLECLQELSISDRLCVSLEFLKFTPNLEKLWIYDSTEEERGQIYVTEIISNTDFQAWVDVQLTNCVDLRLDYLIGSEEIQILIDCFPNLIKLRMPRDKYQFKLACGGWKDTLRELEVLGDDLDDSVVTGLDEINTKAFNRAEAYADADQTVNGEEFTGMDLDQVEAKHPNITDLKYLKRFVMMNSGAYSTQLKDCSVFYGFLKLPRLESISIGSAMKLRARTALMAKLLTCEIFELQNDTGVDISWDTNSDRGFEE